MNQDEGVRARVAGKQAKEEMRIWTLDLYPLQFRCFKVGPDQFVVEGRMKNRWEILARGSDPEQLLKSIVYSNAVGSMIEEKKK